MEFYREQKPQEQEKAKREQAIADAVTRRKQDEWEAKKQELSGAASACCVGLFSCVGLLVRNSQYVYVYIHICIYVYVYVLYVCMYVCIYIYMRGTISMYVCMHTYTYMSIYVYKCI